MIAHAEKRVLKDGSIRWYAMFIGPSGKRTTEGGFRTKREADRVATKRAAEVESGAFIDPNQSRLTFATYVERYYWPAASHLEPTTRAAYRSNLDKHFVPRFGSIRMRQIRPSVIQSWVNDAAESGLSPRTVVKYHTFLHAIFERALVDQFISTNPCSHTALPKVVKTPKKAVTPTQFEALFAEIPADYKMLVLVAIETGVRWGELAALRPAEIDFDTHVITVRRVVLEVTKKITKADRVWTIRDYPKDNEHREIQVSAALCRDLRTYMMANGKRENDLLFSTSRGTPLSRNVFRTRIWRPAIERSKLRQQVRFHDLRGAHASWLLAGGADLKSVMDRLGHRQIMTTQQYLGSLPDAGTRALAAFESIRGKRT